MSKKAQFTDIDINSAIDDFIAATPSRTVPSIGKNSEVTVYGENGNPYKPVIPKPQEDDSDEIQGLID